MYKFLLCNKYRSIYSNKTDVVIKNAIEVVISRSLCFITLFLVLISISKKAYSQQEVIFHQYMNSMQFFNPAYVGIASYTEVSFLSRNQWSAFDDNPVTNSLVFNTPIETYDIGLGCTLFNDKFGPISQTGFFADYSYKIRLSRKRGQDRFISFGVKGGLTIYNSNFGDIKTVDPSDPILVSNIDNQIIPNFGLGVLYYAPNFFVGVSSPRIIQSKITGDKSNDVSYREELYIITTAGYVYSISDYVKLKPYFMMRYESNSPVSFDISAQLFITDLVTFGAMYRLGSSYGIMLDYNIYENISVGYAYDMSTFDTTSYTAGSHEISLRFRFESRKRSYSHPIYY